MLAVRWAGGGGVDGHPDPASRRLVLGGGTRAVDGTGGGGIVIPPCAATWVGVGETVAPPRAASDLRFARKVAKVGIRAGFGGT